MIQLYDYDKDFIKESLTIEQVKDLVAELGGEPILNGEMIISKTICHGGDTHKLWFYSNTNLFHCFTDCGDSFDIFELVRRVKTREIGIEWDLPAAIKFVADYFGFLPNQKNESLTDTQVHQDFKLLANYERISDIKIEKQEIVLKEYKDAAAVLSHLPRPIILPWVADGISPETAADFDICFDPLNQGIVIPHKDIEGRIVGIRERTLIKEEAEKYGKYLPARIHGVMYRHPLSFNLYGLYQNKENIKKIKKAIVFEAEKSVMQYGTMFGKDNNIAVACCGSNLIAYQVKLLMSLGVDEIIVALDRQFQEPGDADCQKLIHNLENIQKKYGNFVKISYIFDKNMLTPYKASPSDCGKEIFMKLFKERVLLY